MIPCNSTNPPTGTTCAAGDEIIGVNFYLPKAQDIKVCAAFGAEFSFSSSDRAYGSYQIAETPSDSETILQDGKQFTSWEIGRDTGITGTNHHVCGYFSMASAGRKTFRLFRKHAFAGLSSALILADPDGNGINRNIHFTVEPLNEAMPTPVFDELRNNITLPSRTTAQQNAIGNEAGRAVFNTTLGVPTYNNGTAWVPFNPTPNIYTGAITCTGSSSINHQRRNGVSDAWFTLSRISGGVCDINFVGGVFTQTPICTCMVTSGSSSPRYCYFYTGSGGKYDTTGFRLWISDPNGTLQDDAVRFQCVE